MIQAALSYLSVGSNLCDPKSQVLAALEAVQSIPHTSITHKASLYQTPPWGGVSQADFVNTVIAIHTRLSPFELLSQLKDIEDKQGRVRSTYLGPRIIDCDIILYGEQQLQTETLVIPHHNMFDRAFVLIPLFEIAPDLIFPDGQLLKDCLNAPGIQAQSRHIRKLSVVAQQ